MMHALLALLDKYSDPLREQTCEWVLHVWTESLPLDGGNDSSAISRVSNAHREPDQSHQHSHSKRRPGSSKKKSHPRSKEPDADSFENMEDLTTPRLCQHQFFTSQCKYGNQKSGCPNVHYPKKGTETLATVLTPSKKAVADDASSYLWKEQLTMSSKAASTGTMDGTENSNSDSIDMLYYFSIPLFSEKEESLEEMTKPTVSEMVSKIFFDRSCAMSSTVYVAINHILLFDRHRDGLVVSESDFTATLLGEDRRLAIHSVSTQSEHHGGEQHTTDEAYTSLVILLPGSILEQIITFLPDSAVPAMCLVCKPWHGEIGQHSPSLWRFLLQRRNWPLPSLYDSEELPVDGDADGEVVNTTKLFRDDFLAHYAIVRDVQAVKAAIPIVLGKSRHTVEEKEMVCQAFSTRRGAPQENNRCTTVKVWSTNRVLAAYEEDCTLRLFEAVSKPASRSTSSSGGNNNHSLSRGCREVVRVRAAPFKNTKKRHCQLIGMDLSDDMVACLCLVHNVEERVKSYMLTVASREDFLCSSDGGDFSDVDSTVHVIDVKETVLNFLSTIEIGNDDSLRQLQGFIEGEGGDTSEIIVTVSTSIVACGYGRFLLDACIEFGYSATFRKLVLFSAITQAPVWVQDISGMPVDDQIDGLGFGPLPALEYAGVSSIQRPSSTGGSRTACSLVMSPSHNSFVWRLEVEPTGPPTFIQQTLATDSIVSNLLEENWEMGRGIGIVAAFSNTATRPICMTPSYILVAHVMSQGYGRKSLVSFYPRLMAAYDEDCNEHSDLKALATLELDVDCEVLRMECIREHHVILLCVVDARISEHSSPKLKLQAFVIHVPTRKVIHRVCLREEDAGDRLLTDRNFAKDMPISFAACGDTIGVAVHWKGIILTGQDVRSIGEEAKSASDHLESKPQNIKNQKKQRQKRQAVKTRKSDPAKGKVKKSY